VCASCPTCMRSAQECTKSLQEAFEQSIILKSVHLEPENQRVAVELPFVKEPVEFLTKKHGRNSNYYQALRVYKSQCRKPDEVKAKLRGSMQDLISRGFMVKLADMDEAKQKVVEDAGFQHYFPWRAVYKEGSVSTPVRIVVDPSASGLNQTLAKGENMLTKIPEVLIAFRSHRHAWCSDISKMYNMLKLSDQALPYSLFLYNDSLSDDAQPMCTVCNRPGTACLVRATKRTLRWTCSGRHTGKNSLPPSARLVWTGIWMTWTAERRPERRLTNRFDK
jgi:hypothetical protein